MIAIDKVKIPEQVRTIIETLEERGFEAYAVGGCIRDSLLGKEPSDWDITTSAKPGEVKACFKKTIDTGIQHGTVTVLMPGRKSYEVTTFRVDGKYSDGRHPDEVIFSPSLHEDLSRRDFTINALVYSESKGLIDDFEGLKDLQMGIIRAVGDPLRRFGEDALRIMRAFRFAAQLIFTIEKDTRAAASKLAENLRQISAERIRVELEKLIVSPDPSLLRDMYEAGITKVILPEFDACMERPQRHPHHDRSVGEHIIKTIQSIEPRDSLGFSDFSDNQRKILCLAALLHDIGKPLTHSVDSEGIDHFHGHAAKSTELALEILRRLKYDNDTIRSVGKLVQYHDAKPPLQASSIRRLMNEVGAELFPMLLTLQRADVLAQSDYKRAEKLEYLSGSEGVYRDILARKDCLHTKDLAVNGKDLMEIGIEKGPGIGKILKGLLEMVLEDPECNKKDYLLKKAMEIEKALGNIG